MSKKDEDRSIIHKSLTRFWGLTQKELKMLLKDRLAMIIAITIPIICVVILAVSPGGIEDIISSEPGFSDRGDPPSEPPIIGLIDQDQTELSSEFVDLIKDYNTTGHIILFFSDSALDYQFIQA